DQVDPKGHQFRGLPAEKIVIAPRPAVFNGDVLAREVATLVEASVERSHELRRRTGESHVEKANHRRLGARPQRPKWADAQKSYDIPPSHRVHRPDQNPGPATPR